MSIRTDPPAPEGQDGLGGVVDCRAGPVVNGVQHARPDEHDYTAQVTYAPTSPLWSFGEPAAGATASQSCAAVSCPPGVGWAAVQAVIVGRPRR